jgi:cellulose synthase/poly-beta-1,6-N-acetylglucosamine synthase-like glycosyltransferase
MKDDRVAAVGGPNLMPADSTFFRRAVAIAVSNYWGNHGSVQGAQFKARVLVDHLPTLNVMYDRSRALQVGGFDENQGNIAEDVDISHQLRWRGYILIYESRAIVRHRWRESIWTWAKNMEVYGKGRSWLMKKDRRYIKLQLAAPLLTLLSLLAACFFPISVWLAAPFAAYLAMTALVSLYACLVAHKPHYVFHVFVIYIVTHIAYAVGQIHGLMSPRGSDIR